MNRRSFIGAALTSSLMSDAGGIVSQEASLPGSSGKGANGGPSIQHLVAQYRVDLFEDFLPFMEMHVIDPVYGGFLCETDGRGVQVATDKYSWFEGRGIWVYSFLYNHLAREKKYLEVARRSVEFILRHAPKSPVETWPFHMTREGNPLSSPDPEIYGNLFIAEGLSEYSVATEEPRYWQMAKVLLLKAVQIYDRIDYYPEIGKTYLGPQARPFPGARIQGVWMVLIRICTQMLRTHRDEDIAAIAARCVDAVVNHHFNPRFELNNELLNHDLTRSTNEYEQLVYTGHCLEISWMLLDEALRIGDDTLFAVIAERFRRHVEVAEDRVYGGVFRDLMDVDENKWTLDKVLWAQEEVTIGALMIFEHTGYTWAWDMFLRFDQYTRQKYQLPLKRLGIPLWIYGADREVTLESYYKDLARVENYHHPRHLMLNLLRLERMERNKTAVPQSSDGLSRE